MVKYVLIFQILFVLISKIEAQSFKRSEKYTQITQHHKIVKYVQTKIDAQQSDDKSNSVSNFYFQLLTFLQCYTNTILVGIGILIFILVLRKLDCCNSNVDISENTCCNCSCCFGNQCSCNCCKNINIE